MGYALRYVLIGLMWFTLVVQLGMILGQLGAVQRELMTLERVIRNIDSATVTIANKVQAPQ
jgi:hypothetical protein